MRKMTSLLLTILLLAGCSGGTQATGRGEELALETYLLANAVPLAEDLRQLAGSGEYFALYMYDESLWNQGQALVTEMTPLPLEALVISLQPDALEKLMADDGVNTSNWNSTLQKQADQQFFQSLSIRAIATYGEMAIVLTNLLTITESRAGHPALTDNTLLVLSYSVEGDGSTGGCIAWVSFMPSADGSTLVHATLSPPAFETDLLDGTLPDCWRRHWHRIFL